MKRICVLNSESGSRVLALASLLARSSTHPFSQAICRYAESRPDLDCGSSAALTDIRSIPGRGVEAFNSDHSRLRLGSVEHAFADSAFTPGRRMLLTRVLATADQEAASVVALSVADQPVAVFALTETLRPDAAHVMRQCADLGLYLSVLTGDRASRAEQLRENLLSSCTPEDGTSGRPAESIPLSVECELQPHEKLDRMLRLRDLFGSVAMVGDGINDASACAAEFQPR